MKKLLTLLTVLFCVSCSKVPSGHVGVKVYLLGGDKGVDSEVVGIGRYWVGINEELYLFPVFQQTKVYTQDKREDSPEDESFTFQTKEGLSCNVDLGVTFTIDASKISSLFQKYRKGVEELKSVVIKNALRDALNSVATKLPVESVYGEGKTEILNAIEKMIQEQLKPHGIIIEKVYLVGAIRLPENVVAALNSKIEATQRAQQRENELREEEAESKKKIAKAEGQAKSIILTAEAEAKANTLVRQSLTKELINYLAAQKWNGQLPMYFGGEMVPFLNINSK